MSHPTNSNWGNGNDGVPSNQKQTHPLVAHGRQKAAGFSYENTWQRTNTNQQEMAMGPQPVHLQQDQHPYWNDNASHKPPSMTVPQSNYQSKNASWSQQPQYVPHQQQTQHMQQQFSNPSNPYYDYAPNQTPVFNSPQMNFRGSNPGGDPWNWDWDDSSNNSPATSFSTNNNFQNDSSWNWNVDDSQEQTAATTATPTTSAPPTTAYNPVHNYFRSNEIKEDGKVAQIEHLMNDINIQPNLAKAQKHPDVEHGTSESKSNIIESKSETLNQSNPEPVNEVCTKVEAVESFAEVNLTSIDLGEMKIEEPFLGGLPPKPKSERLSPNCGQSCDVEEPTLNASSDPPQAFQSVSPLREFKTERLSPVAGREVTNDSNPDSSAFDISTPPPGLDRMVLGQLTESENDTPSVPEVAHHHHNRHHHIQDTRPTGLQRIVFGQLPDHKSQTSADENADLSSSMTAPDDIPPPGFHRMIPGESSSPETQNVNQMSMDSLPREQRVVTGVARDEIDVNVLQTGLPSPSPPTPVSRLSSNQPPSPDEGRIQFQSERCETIGSDNVDSYAVSTGDIGSAKSSKRKENKDRDRHLDDITSDEGEREQSRRREKDSGYYSQRGSVNRDREESPHRDRQRYRDRRSKGRDLLDWERDRRSESPGRYRDDKDRRRDYRGERRRHLDQYYSDDDDADTNGYYSDRDQRNMSGYRDDYDRTYPRRDDRARSLKPEKLSRDRNDERPSGKDRRRGDYSDRDRIRDRDRPSDYYRRRGHDEVDDYRDSQRSRPSSRSDSVHDYKHRGRTDYEDDRDRGRDRYRNAPKRDRDMFYPGYNYDPAYYNYYYQYYENLRRSNPAAYTEWCRKYYAQSQHGTFDGSYTEDRGSVHSGRSSANEDSKDRYIKEQGTRPYGSPRVYPCYQSIDQAYPYHSYSSDTGEHDTRRSDVMDKNSSAAQRLTPAKFTTAHVKGSLTPRGQLIKILPHYPLDGQPATLEIHEQLSCHNELRKELQDFPGPLIRGTTHKNNILRYCKQKIKDADVNTSLYDKDSYKLIWELLMLLIRQNGTVVGTDIAELLMTNRTAHTSIHQSSSGPHYNPNDSLHQPNLSEEEITNQFRDYLIYGNSKEALEWAMKHGLWGHALFLASKMDQRTYASVMTRFANGLTMNDPLQTLYQLMSGRQPASVTCCADEKWGDWRPHLAMILSNSTARPDLDVKTVTTLGDTLGSRGNLHAAHFCYLMAQIEFGTYSHKSSKIVLIGSSHNQPFNQFSTNEAIFATEIFEFACSLADPDFALHHLQVYKLLVARRLMEVGLVQEAVHYAEVIANVIAKHPSSYSPQFIQEVYDVGNMLKYSDPVYNSGETAEGSGSDPDWLSRLLAILGDYQMGILQHDGYGSASNLTNYSENDGFQYQNTNLDAPPSEPVRDNQSWQQKQQQQVFYEQSSIPHLDVSDHNQTVATEGYMGQDQPIITGPPTEESNQNYWYNGNHWLSPQQPQHQGQESVMMLGGGSGECNSVPQMNVVDSKPQPMYDYFDANRNEGGKPQITMPNSRQRTFSQSSEEKKPPQPKPKTAKKEPGKAVQGGGSWFGGIFNKLPFRPKNQMILPDDKNPSIVWDSDKKRWVNLDGDEDESMGGPPPPPKASELPTPAAPLAYPPAKHGNPTAEQVPLQQPIPDAAPTLSAPNKYKMSRGKNFRSNYVDVMNPGGSAKVSSPSVPAPDLFPSSNYPPQLPTSYMIPAPVEGNENAPTDFLTPSTGSMVDTTDASQPQALSRWSSTSSLSREVQKYTFKQVRMPKSPAHGVSDYTSHNNQWNGGATFAQKPPVNLGRMQGYPK